MKLFRYIRKQYASENKAMAYLRYAIGETILVMVGILLALQVNNWNEARKNSIIENEIVANLHAEFKQNLIVLNEVAEVFNKSEQSCYQLMLLMNKDASYLSQNNIDSLIYWSIDFTSFNPSNNVLDETLQSGRLGLIKNKELVSDLFDWKRVEENLQSNYIIRQKFIEEQIMPYLNDNISFKNIDKYSPMHWESPSEFRTDYTSLFHDRKFENLIDNNFYHLAKLREEYIHLGKIMDKMIEETK